MPRPNTTVFAQTPATGFAQAASKGDFLAGKLPENTPSVSGGVASAPLPPHELSLHELCDLTLQIQRDVLVVRGASYGDFADNAQTWIELLQSLGFTFPKGWTYVQIAATLQMTSKLSRICESPSHQDSWLDIANYANLTHSDNLRRGR